MPSTRPSADPSKNRRMFQAAREGMVIMMRCGACRREVCFWASDLAKVLGDHQIHVPPWPCSKCGTMEFVHMFWEIPNSAKLAGLTVRRPVRKIERWIWRDEKA